MQLILSILKDYGVIIGSILTVSLTSILLSQRNEIKKNRKIIAESLTGSSGTLYISMKNILNRSKVSDLSRELKEFFEKNASDHESIVKLKDKRIIRQFLELEEQYYDYVLNESSEKLDKLMINFVYLKNEIEKIFFAEHRVINKDINWHLIVEKTENIWFRLFLKFYKFINHTVTFSVVLTGFLVFLSLIDKLFNYHVYDGISKYAINGFIFSIVLYFPVLLIQLFIYLNDPENSNRINIFYKEIIPKKLGQNNTLFRWLAGGDAKKVDKIKALKEYEEKYKGQFTTKGGE
ncbi:hypothetical protein AAYR27_14720 [Bacillus safensis]|nr:hypothetical protein [Bacillus safensis]KKD42578.1 hypothetical protein KU48_04575 [Bacillus safensis]MCM3448817.1 hypothetical protein [Bacillus safensis]MCY7466486.1 hypothetical protein [Bacillus safensis]MDP4564621.1 hypothetical protein [Bacillus safensis]MDR6681631.1 hypothetical protein [Bacillus safensis]